MSLTSQDLEAFARRIRPHFEPPLRDVAEEFALAIGQFAGAGVKQLRAKTTLDEIVDWLKLETDDPLDRVEALMALEEEVGFQILDEEAQQSAATSSG